MDIGKQVKRLRESKGLTKTRLAKLSGVSQSYISDIEAGKKKPTVEILAKICSALGISLPDFFAGEYKVDPDALYLSSLMKGMSEEERKALINYIQATMKRQEMKRQGK